MTCASCQRELEEGMDVIGVQEGIMGSRGFVRLEEPLLVCSKECLRGYFGNGEKPVERIP